MSTPTLDVYNPYNGHCISQLPLATEAEIEQALHTASELSRKKHDILESHERIRILENVIQLMTVQKEELIRVAVDEGGKPWNDTEVEVNRAIEGVKIAIRHLCNMTGIEVPMGLTPSSTNRLAFTQCEPIGVVLSISAFNHPLNLIVHQTIPAIAVGAPVIIKPALTTPMSCSMFMRILTEAGLPDGWCKMIVCTDELTERMACDRRVKYLSFIGSSRVGWYLRSKIAPGTRCALEHGGVAPVIVDEVSGLDIDDMIGKLTKGAFYHAGQVCVSVQRVFVEKSNVEYVTEKIAEASSKIKVGDPMKTQTDVGPMITTDALDRVQSWVETAKRDGVRNIYGGSRLDNNCYQPTVLLDPPYDSQVSRNEIFGPVVCVYSYEDIDRAIAHANSVPYGFQASIFSSNIDQILSVGGELNASTVMINDHTAFRTDWMPFGGRDESGLGLGGIPYTMNEVTHHKMFVIHSRKK